MGRMDILIDDMEDYGFDDIKRASLARLIDDAHKELCLREPWPFLERELSFTQAANTAVVNPAGFSSTPLGKVLGFVNLTDKIVLTPLRTEAQLKDYVFSLDESGLPTDYYFVGDTLKVYPVSSAECSLRIRYLTQPATLTTSSADSAFLWPERHDAVLLYAALSKAYYINDDPQGAAMQQVMEARLQIARDDLWMKQYDRTDRMIVMDDNEYLF
jgi:hypothetical protein